MPYDTQREGFTIAGLEEDVECSYPLGDGRTVNLSGRADRIDLLPNGTLQVIDYKSGNKPHLEFGGMEALFYGRPHERISNIFQTLLYAMMLQRTRSRDAMPSLYYASKMVLKGYSPQLINRASGEIIESYGDVAEEFEAFLREALVELFDQNTPFRQADDEDACTYCDFKSICRR